MMKLQFAAPGCRGIVQGAQRAMEELLPEHAAWITAPVQAARGAWSSELAVLHVGIAYGCANIL